jgi:hypothetical protein
VTFDVVRTLHCERSMIRDEAKNYLWHHWDVLVEVNYQPALAAYAIRGQGVPVQVAYDPVAHTGQMPGDTDLAILTRLFQPRGLLRLTAAGVVILETPTLIGNGRMPCDCTGGPFIEVVGVPLMVGLRHWVVTLHIKADVRDYVSDNTDKNCVLSNLWVGTEDVDFRRRSIRRFAGRAILRADVMRMHQNTPGGINANLFRDLYVFPCPDHYQRQNVHVQLSEDGTILDWSFEDAMRGYDLGAGSPILDIECFRTGYITAGSPLKGTVDAARSTGLGIIGDLLSPIANVGRILNTPGRAFVNTVENLPKAYINCRCDLTGDRNADLGKLSAIALGVVMNQIGLNVAALLTGVYEIIFRQDLADNVYTSAEFTVRWTDDVLFAGAAAMAAGGGAGALPGALSVLQNGSAQIVRNFTTDQKTLKVAALGINTGGPSGLPDANVGAVADRSGGINQNPAFFGTNGSFGLTPLGGTNRIEPFIVQALLGQELQPQTPPVPSTLRLLSGVNAPGQF